MLPCCCRWPGSSSAWVRCAIPAGASWPGAAPCSARWCRRSWRQRRRVCRNRANGATRHRRARRPLRLCRRQQSAPIAPRPCAPPCPENPDCSGSWPGRKRHRQRRTRPALSWRLPRRPRRRGGCPARSWPRSCWPGCWAGCPSPCAWAARPGPCGDGRVASLAGLRPRARRCRRSPLTWAGPCSLRVCRSCAWSMDWPAQCCCQATACCCLRGWSTCRRRSNAPCWPMN